MLNSAPVKKFKTFLKTCLKWLVVAILVIGGLFTLLLAVRFGGHLLTRDYSLSAWTAVVLLVGIAFVLGWIAYREIKPQKLSLHASDWPHPFGPAWLEDLVKELYRLNSVSTPVLIENFNLQLERGQHQAALNDLSRLRAVAPDNWAVANLIADVLCGQGRLVEAAASYDEIISRYNLPKAVWTTIMINRIGIALANKDGSELLKLSEGVPGAAIGVAEKSYLLDTLACSPMVHGISVPLERALHWIILARSLDQESITLKGTHGSLLVEAGRVEEALPLLEETFQTSISPIDQGIAALYLGIIKARSGDYANARGLFAKARNCYFQPWMQQRLVSEGIKLSESNE